MKYAVGDMVMKDNSNIPYPYIGIVVDVEKWVGKDCVSVLWLNSYTNRTIPEQYSNPHQHFKKIS